MYHVMGSAFLNRCTIQVEFQEVVDNNYGVISAHTCSSTITLPIGDFHTYDIFKESMKAVIGGEKTFNTF